MHALLFLHIISFVCWMAGIFYLPRLYVYHCSIDLSNSAYKTFTIMEAKLIKIIMNPAAISTFITGIALARIKYGGQSGNHWLTIKGAAAVLLAIFHIYLIKIQKIFLEGKNTKEHKFYRIINEIPSILLIIIVWMVVYKPL